MNAPQLQRGPSSVGEEISKDGRASCNDPAIFPPELIDTSLLEPNEKIPAGNASSVAVMNYAREPCR